MLLVFTLLDKYQKHMKYILSVEIFLKFDFKKQALISLPIDCTEHTYYSFGPSSLKTV